MVVVQHGALYVNVTIIGPVYHHLASRVLHDLKDEATDDLLRVDDGCAIKVVKVIIAT